nr:uncharacterized protein LOC105869252 isoform X2 [Microcebus murinus]
MGLSRPAELPLSHERSPSRQPCTLPPCHQDSPGAAGTELGEAALNKDPLSWHRSWRGQGPRQPAALMRFQVSREKLIMLMIAEITTPAPFISAGSACHAHSARLSAYQEPLGLCGSRYVTPWERAAGDTGEAKVTRQHHHGPGQHQASQLLTDPQVCHIPCPCPTVQLEGRAISILQTRKVSGSSGGFQRSPLPSCLPLASNAPHRGQGSKRGRGQLCRKPRSQSARVISEMTSLPAIASQSLGPQRRWGRGRNLGGEQEPVECPEEAWGPPPATAASLACLPSEGEEPRRQRALEHW